MLKKKVYLPLNINLGVKPLLTAEQLSELKKLFSKPIPADEAIIMVGKQNMQFYLSKKNFKYLIPNQG